MNVNTCHLSSTLLNSFVQYFTARQHGRECVLDTVEIRWKYRIYWKFNRKWKKEDMEASKTLSQRITFYTTLVQREKLDECLEKQKSIGSFVLAIPIIPLVNISSMAFKYRVRRCMVLLELLYFNACSSTVTKCNCNIEILKIWNIWNSIHNRLF